jgi:arylsulfatase A-like enzyme
MDCHADYLPPSPFDRKFDPDYTGEITGHVQSRRFKTDLDKRDVDHIISLYDGEIAYVDAQIGQLIDHLTALELIRNTCIILTADHGEEFLEHGNWGHGHTLFEECVRVPLLIHWPEQVPANCRIAVPASIVDVLPTVLAMVGIARPAACLGADLGGLMKGKSRQPDRPIIMETSLGCRLRAMISGSQKLILPTPQISETQPAVDTDRVLMFNLADNPKEDAKKTITDTRQREALMTRYCAAVADLAKTTQTLSTRAKNSLESDDEHIGRLRSLGYLGD